MQDFDIELRRLREQTARQAMLRSRLEGLQRRHSQLAEQERELYTDRIEEAEDVENLEGRSLARYFYSLFGSLDERLDKERTEARAAAVKHDAVLNELEDVETEMASVERELSSLAGCERRYDELLERKAEALKASGTGAGARLREIERELSQVEYRRRETEEAMNAGRYAESAAEDVINCLSGASTWGVVDLFSDSVFADMAKYSHIDNAQRAMERLRSALRRFGAELEDVGGRVDVSMGDFMGFADVFFDNVFVDMAVNSRINNSLYSAQDALRRIRSANSRLAGMLNECAARGRQLDDEYERVVTGA